MARKLKPLTSRQFASSMDDPDKVGQSEYRILHELVQEIVEGDGSEHGDLDLIASSMDEVIEWARAIKKDIAKAKRGIASGLAYKAPKPWNGLD